MRGLLSGARTPSSTKCRCAYKWRSPAANLPRNTSASTFTGRKNRGEAVIQRLWSSASPPAGTTQ